MALSPPRLYTYIPWGSKVPYDTYIASVNEARVTETMTERSQGGWRKSSRRVEIKVETWKKMSSMPPMPPCPRSERRLISLYASKDIAPSHSQKWTCGGILEPNQTRPRLRKWKKSILLKNPFFLFGMQLFLIYLIPTLPSPFNLFLMRVPWKSDEECERKKRYRWKERYWMCSEVSNLLWQVSILW